MNSLRCALLGAPLLACIIPMQPADSAVHDNDNHVDVSGTPEAVSNADILVVGQRDAPISIEPRGLSISLGDQQFAGVNAVNTEDLIKYAPDFFVRTRFIGDNNAVPGFRGTHSTQSARSLVMVDGFVISNFLGNSYSYPPAWGIVSPREVKQFDIVYGPYSARYPGNSMGGVVNITTRAPDKTGATFDLQQFYQPYDQFATHDHLWGYSAQGAVSIRQKNSPWGVRVSARRLINQGQPQQFYLLGFSPAAYDNPALGTPVTGAVVDPHLPPLAGTNLAPPVAGDYSVTQLSQDLVRGELRYDSGDLHAELLLAYWWNEERNLEPKTYLRDATGKPFYGDATGLVSLRGVGYALDPSTSFRWSIAHKNEWLAGGRIEGRLGDFDVRLNLSSVQFDRQDLRQSNGYAAGRNDGAGQWTRQGPTGWVTGDLVASRTIGAHALAIGVNANRYRTDQSIYATSHWREATAPRLQTRTFGRTSTIGMFGEDVIALDKATHLTLGLRYDRWRAFGGGLIAGEALVHPYPDRHDSAWSPKLALSHDFAGGWTAEFSLAEATRFATVGELFQGTLNGDGSFNPDSFDPDLRPERSHDANLIVRHDFGPVSLTGSVFYQRVKNTIFQFSGFNQNGVLTTTYKNIDLTRQYGVEMIAQAHDWPIRGIDIDANAAWLDAATLKNRADPASQGVQFPRIPHWRLGGNVRYHVTPRLQAVMGLRYASRPNSDLDGRMRGDDYGYTSELFALDLRANLKINDHLRLSAGINNLTNDRAWVYHPYPQRTFLLEAGVTL